MYYAGEFRAVSGRDCDGAAETPHCGGGGGEGRRMRRREVLGLMLCRRFQFWWIFVTLKSRALATPQKLRCKILRISKIPSHRHQRWHST